MKLDDVNTGVTKYKTRKRLGRGTGSGLGKTSGRGHKGQHSRAGSSQQATFHGGAMPMFRRIPKRGFNNKFALRVGEVNIADLERHFEAGQEVNAQTLKEKNLASYRYDVLKVLGNGELTKRLTVHADRFSLTARQKIEQAGGTVVVLPGKKPVVKNKQKPKKR